MDIYLPRLHQHVSRNGHAGLPCPLVPVDGCHTALSERPALIAHLLASTAAASVRGRRSTQTKPALRLIDPCVKDDALLLVIL